MKAEPRKCVECKQVLPVFKTVEQRVGIERGSTRYRIKPIHWCQGCWEKNEQWAENYRKSEIDAIRKYAKSKGIKID